MKKKIKQSREIPFNVVLASFHRYPKSSLVVANVTDVFHSEIPAHLMCISLYFFIASIAFE